MSPVAPLETPFQHRVIVEDFSDKEFVPPIRHAVSARLIIAPFFPSASSPMSFLSVLHGLDPEPPLPPLPSPRLEPPSLDGQQGSPSRSRPRPGRTQSPTGTKSHKSKSKSRERERDRPTRERSRSRGTDPMLTMMLVEEERNSSNLKVLLQMTRDRLDTETRRGDAAESRAMLAEARAREASGRAATVEQGLHRCELEQARAEEETKRARMQLETVERELRRVTGEVQRLTRQKEEADGAAAKARDLARRWQSALRDYQAHDEGRQEGIRLALIRRYDDGREEGWEEGREEGFLEGQRVGFEEGRELGMRERVAPQVVHRDPHPHPLPHQWRESPRYMEERVIPDRALFNKPRSEVRLVVLRLSLLFSLTGVLHRRVWSARRLGLTQSVPMSRFGHIHPKFILLGWDGG